MRRALACAVVLLSTLATAAHAGSTDDARHWLERMSRSLGTLNYVGLFTHGSGSDAETMRIIHRAEGGRSQERLVSLDGSGREIVRTPEEVHFYMPDRRVVLVEPRTDDGSLFKGLPVPGPELDALYTLSVGDKHRLLGRDVRVIDIRPRDAFRYGYRLWLDEETAMPLRSVVLTPDGRAVESVHFTQFETPRSIEPRDLEPGVDATGYQWLRSGKRRDMAKASVGWRPTRIPPGFRLVGSRLQVVPGVPVPVQHLIFSDGFASVSVFIEPGPAKGPKPAESTSAGSANTYSTQVQGHVVTAVGEVPPETVREIATSLAPVDGADTR